MTRIAVLLSVALTSCATPRIIVLNDPLTPEEHLDPGVAYEQDGKPELALSEYEKASTGKPVAFIFLGNLHAAGKRYTDAQRAYRKAIEMMPKNADAYNNLAWVFYEQRTNLDESRRLAQKAINLATQGKTEVYRDTLRKIEEAIATSAP
jgi:tetratricopeptide (TPR) repeat protein